MASSIGWALPPQEAQKMYDELAPSLVAVQYTVDGEFGRRELIGQAVIIGEEGTVIASLALFPTQIPDEQMKDFKIIIPGDEEKELDAVFLGRDERSDLVFLKTREPQKWKALKFQEQPLNVGDEVISVGLLPKEAGYKVYYSQARVSALLRGPVPHVLTTAEGLAATGSPVFTADGKPIGLVAYQQGQSMLLNGNNSAMQLLANPPRFFVPARDFLPSLSDPPKGEPLRLPWVGAPLIGITKEVAEYYNMKNATAAQVGEVIPQSPAAKAGLKAGDKIVKVNGEKLERGDEPEETPRILLRKIRRMKPGDKIVLSVMREKDKPSTDITVTLEEQPRQANLARRFYAEDLGMSVREVVFADTYAKRVAADTKGVVVAYVRQASSAASASLRMGDLVTEINKTAVADLEGFKKTYKDFRAKSPKEQVVLVVIREQKTEVIKIEPPQ
jgi:S1-C subfamily serine protease